MVWHSWRKLVNLNDLCQIVDDRMRIATVLFLKTSMRIAGWGESIFFDESLFPILPSTKRQK
jgi:hypothetical protein